MLKNKYPRIEALGLKVETDPLEYVNRRKLNGALKKKHITKLFGKLYGIQTSYIDGPYADDVEAVLERIASGKLIGSQLLWD